MNQAKDLDKHVLALIHDSTTVTHKASSANENLLMNRVPLKLVKKKFLVCRYRWLT